MQAGLAVHTGNARLLCFQARLLANQVTATAPADRPLGGAQRLACGLAEVGPAGSAATRPTIYMGGERLRSRCRARDRRPSGSTRAVVLRPPAGSATPPRLRGGPGRDGRPRRGAATDHAQDGRRHARSSAVGLADLRARRLWLSAKGHGPGASARGAFGGEGGTTGLREFRELVPPTPPHAR